MMVYLHHIWVTFVGQKHRSQFKVTGDYSRSTALENSYNGECEHC